jgi:serine/threonine-protein kinase
MNEAVRHWEVLQERFHEVLTLPPDARTAALTALATSDPSLAGELGLLLEAHESPGPLGALEAEAFVVPERVGPYRLLSPLGEGGMGTVWLAERRQEDVVQRVALKLLRTGFVDPMLEERLKAERRILARLDHPCIARFIDGGTTPAGQPFYAMEYVEGSTLLEHCRKSCPGLAERLRIFLQVCEAVHYAHQQLVVHRDLKPGNVLVSQEGRPRLLDFGTAKLMDEATGLTPWATTLWFTPAYASPEQVRGEPATTSSDVYALGVMLFELLTGRRPYTVPARPHGEVVRVICESTPAKPSQSVDSAAGFAAAPERIGRFLEGDLDTIVLKALAKDPARRYASVEQLADDLRRHLDGHPVLARPDRLGYRFAKFVGRHQTSVAAASFLAAALLVGLVVTSSLATRAARERDRAQEALRQSQDVTSFLLGLFTASSPDEVLSDTLAARELLRRGLTRVSELGDQPAVQARMLDALGTVYERLGQYPQADELLERALQLQRALLGSSHPDVAATLDHLGVVRRRTGRYADSERFHLEALAIRRATFGEEHALVAETLSNIAFLMPYLGRDQEASDLYARILAMRRRLLGPDHPDLATTLISLASMRRRLGQQDESEAFYREAVALRSRGNGPDHPETAAATVHLADFMRDIRADSTEAERLYRGAITIQRDRLGPDHPSLIHALGSLADLVEARGDRGEARRLVRESLRIVSAVYGETHPTVAGAYLQNGLIAQRAGDLFAAESLYRKAMDIDQRLYGSEHFTVAELLGRLAELGALRGQWDVAESLGRASVAMRRRVLDPAHGSIPEALIWLADLLRRGEKREAARALYAEALEAERARPDRRPDLIARLEAGIPEAVVITPPPVPRATQR